MHEESTIAGEPDKNFDPMRLARHIGETVLMGLLVSMTAGLFGRSASISVTRWGWLAAALYWTYTLASMHGIKKGALRLRAEYGDKPAMSYGLVVIIAGVIGVCYWWGINKIYDKAFALSAGSSSSPSTVPTPVATPSPHDNKGATEEIRAHPTQTAIPHRSPHEELLPKIASDIGEIKEQLKNRGGRTLRNEDRKALMSFLAQHPGCISVDANMSSAEAISYARQWESLLRDAGWKVLEGAYVMPSTQWKGTSIVVHGPFSKYGEEVILNADTPELILAKALMSTGNSVGVHSDPKSTRGNIKTANRHSTMKSERGEAILLNPSAFSR